jgi:hypothetical protein
MTKDASGVRRGRSWGWALMAIAAATLAGCPKQGGAGDAGDGGESEGAAPVPEAAPPLAANEVDVTRYPDEKATVGSTLTTEGSAELRTEVGTGGKLVVVLKKGTEVDKIAEHASHYLVVGEDPKDAARKLMGWAAETAFTGGGGGFHGGVPSAPVVRSDGGGAAPVAPSGGFSCVKQEAGKCAAGFKVSGAVCRLMCKTPADCRGPEAKCNEGLCYAANGCQ